MNITEDELLKALNRETVKSDYESAKNKNFEQFILKNTTATSEYIYQNQKDDALSILNIFYRSNIRAVSIIKRTKVGMDGLMIEIAYKFSTHIDDDFMINRNNIFFITGMSNRAWEEDMKDKIPNCFRENVFHHGKLQKLKKKLIGIKNVLIINDEIDTGDKKDQKLHKILRDSGILDIKYMDENNIKFIFVSATIINELKELYKWGEKHHSFKMSIPPNYISHGEFLELGIIKQFYKIDNLETANEWIKNDIIDNYKKDYRVHIIRSDIENNEIIKNACEDFGIKFYNHTSSNRISYEDLSNIFNNLNNHVVIAVKGFYRRANLIPNSWKQKIGAIHERYCVEFDTNVQVQGLVGRMTGYWKDIVRSGHKTGPYRPSIESIIQYENFYSDPTISDKYNSNGNKNIFLHPDFVGINYVENNQKEICNKHVPIIINLNKLDKETEIYYLTGKNVKIEYLKKIISGHSEYQRLFNYISNPNVYCIGFITPETPTSYKMHITEAINHSKKNKPFIINLDHEDKKRDNWQCFIDNKKNNLCVLIWTITNYIY